VLTRLLPFCSVAGIGGTVMAIDKIVNEINHMSAKSSGSKTTFGA